MALGEPDKASQIEDRIKSDVQREAPDSNPYVKVHWLRTLIAGIALRIFDFYRDMNRAISRLFPDTADSDSADRWGGIYIGPRNSASGSSGVLVATGTAGSSIPPGTTLTAEGQEFTVTSGGTISTQSVAVLSITRSGTTATVTTASDHGLSSFVPVTISGANEGEYNVVDAAIVVTAADQFTYQVAGSPASPATGTVLAGFTAGNVGVESVGVGAETNDAADSPVKLQSPIVGVDDTLYVTYGTLGGGTDQETTPDYVARYLDKIRNPVAHFNEADIIATAKAVPGVTRVFPQRSGTIVGTFSVTTLTRSGAVATAVTAAAHGLESGMSTTITGALEPEYNVTDARVLVEDSTTLHFIVQGAPSSPATGAINGTAAVSLGQSITYFTRDNDDDGPIPSASEVATVKSALDAILPVNTQSADNIVAAPTAVPVDYTFIAILPDTPTMQTAIAANLQQFHDERVDVGADVTEDAYRAAIQNTVDTATGDRLLAFTLSAPVGDVTVNAGGLATRGAVTF